MVQNRAWRRAWRHLFHASLPRVFRSPPLGTVAMLSFGGCDPRARGDDTLGQQQAARWVWHGRVRLEFDTLLTVARVRVDSGLEQRHDVIFARYDFDPATGVGDEYALTALRIGLLALKQARGAVKAQKERLAKP